MDHSEVNPLTQETGVTVSSIKNQAVNVTMFDQSCAKSAMMVATMISTSSMIPSHYQNRPENVLVAIYRADRLKMDVFAYMDTTFPVNGKTGHEAKFVVALLNKSGTYKGPIRYEMFGEIIRDANGLISQKSTRGCKAWAILREDGSRVEQEVKIEMAFLEGWALKPGADRTLKSNKWNTMPDVMLQYRSAKFLGNMYSPEIILGMNLKEELEDIQEVEVIDDAAGKDIFTKGNDISTAADPILDPAREIKQESTSAPAQAAKQAEAAQVVEPVKTEVVASVVVPLDQKQEAVPAASLSDIPPSEIPAFREWLLQRFSGESSMIDAFLINKKWLKPREGLPALTDAQLRNFLAKWESFKSAYAAFKATWKAA